ncbi:MAG: hypothetical protein JOZ96_04820 [Acidobacteria bacterium]|nr:hypothetical protein [Acidobacteriota bacterium]
MPKTLRFGIESLDKLIGPDLGLNIVRVVKGEGGKEKVDSGATTSICLKGPDGTGKSVLALHLAARYMADCGEEYGAKAKKLPKVLYISTDLTHSMAQTVWDNFDLRRPTRRGEPFGTHERMRREGLARRKVQPAPVAETLELLERTPGQMSRVLSGESLYAIYFVDLAQTTAGDDWGFLHKLLSVLEQRDASLPRDLVLLDAVEGFETMVGDLNAFGDKSTRRSRIAQVMRLAAKKCHLLFVVEEVRHERLPEEFVTDAVIRLRNVEINGYLRRTVEVEKTRGQTHARGQHPFVIRDGNGSTTGDMQYENYDDPRVYKAGMEPGAKSLPPPEGGRAGGKKPAKDKGRTQSYVQVFPSINKLSRELMEQRGERKMEPEPDKYAAFGIPYLDTILGGEGDLGRSPDGSDTRGLPCSSVTALIGDALTSKGVLGRAFLSRTFFHFACALAERVKGAGLVPRGRAAPGQARPDGKLRKDFRGGVEAEAGKMLEEGFLPGVALMMTTQDKHVESLSREFIRWLNPKSLFNVKGRAYFSEDFEQVLKLLIERKTICRRLEVHDMSSPVLAHVFKRNIEAAQIKLLGRERFEQMNVDDRFRESWRIRMVIDDFNAFRNTFPDIHNDPLLVPFLLFQIGREGISTLVIDTQSGKPDIALAERFESSLREAADYRLYTWRIPFYGETRIAITAIPPLSTNSRGLIRELKGQGMHGLTRTDEDREDMQLTVDPHFELYAGLERGLPHPVPLEVRLFTSSRTLGRYIEEENVFFKEMFVPNAPRTDVIVGFDPPDYEALREFCYLQRDTRLNHTLVFQVDEFWLTWLTRLSRSRKSNVLQRQWQYLDTVTVDGNGQPDPAADAYHLFQETQPYDPPPDEGGVRGGQSPESARRGELRRRDFYDDERLEYGFGQAARKDAADFEEVDRVPFLWDFAFLLCRENLWEEYLAGETSTNKAGRRVNVEEVWANIRKAKYVYGPRREKGVSWLNFLGACKEVAEYHSARTSTAIPAFDFTTSDGESFSCLFLEIWASETYDCRRQYVGEENAFRFARALSRKLWKWRYVNEDKDTTSLLRALVQEKGKSLTDLLYDRKHGATPDKKVTGYSLELYKSWLLLTEVLDFKELANTPNYLSFGFPRQRQANPQAVAAHHWYQSACDLIDQTGSAEGLVAARLPGHFSVRGDWFLSVAGGSRSGRLAHRAFDLLSSRRANIKRLQLGLGLPVRRIVDDDDDLINVRTRLVSTDQTTGRLDNVSYLDFLAIRGQTLKGRYERQGLGEEFYWLWRSSLYGYARYSRVWQKWLNRMAGWWNTIYTRHKTGWTPGFEVYQQINNYLYPDPDKPRIDDPAFFEKYESWRDFPRFRDILLTELQQVSFGSR